jgi:hypothetical protein
MQNDEAIAASAAAELQAGAETEANNEQAMGDNDVFAADTVLDAANIASDSSLIGGQTAGQALIDHAAASLANAEAMADATP